MWRARVLARRLILRRLQPVAPIALDQLVGRARSPRAGLVVRKIARRMGLPRLQDRRGDLPGGVDHVGAMEEGRIADHTVIDQRLVAGAGTIPLQVAVSEHHFHLSRADSRAWTLGPD